VSGKEIESLKKAVDKKYNEIQAAELPKMEKEFEELRKRIEEAKKVKK
jgi:hypothetical protein